MMAENTEIDNDFIQIIDAETLDDMKMILTFSTDERRLLLGWMKQSIARQNGCTVIPPQ